jgi:hypothetical protein
MRLRNARCVAMAGAVWLLAGQTGRGADFDVEKAKLLAKAAWELETRAIRRGCDAIEVAEGPGGGMHVVSLTDACAVDEGGARRGLYFVEKATGAVYRTAPYENLVTDPKLRLLREQLRAGRYRERVELGRGELEWDVLAGICQSRRALLGSVPLVIVDVAEANGEFPVQPMQTSHWRLEGFNEVLRLMARFDWRVGDCVLTREGSVARMRIEDKLREETIEGDNPFTLMLVDGSVLQVAHLCTGPHFPSSIFYYTKAYLAGDALQLRGREKEILQRLRERFGPSVVSGAIQAEPRFFGDPQFPVYDSLRPSRAAETGDGLWRFQLAIR